MATYDELRTQFTSLLNRRDLTTTLRDTFIQQGISRAQRKIRTPALDRSIEVTMDTDSDTELLIPIDMLKLINLTVDNRRLRMVDVNTALARAQESGIPEVFARRDAKWLLGPKPQDGQVIRIDYMSEDDPLVDGTDESNLSVTAPSLIIYAALSYACDHFQDKRGAQFETRFQMEVKELNDMADDDELSGGAQISAAYNYEDDL